MVKLDVAVGESSADQKICKSNVIVLTYEKFGGLHLVEHGLMEDRQARS